jgi:hypothetical protein
VADRCRRSSRLLGSTGIQHRGNVRFLAVDADSTFEYGEKRPPRADIVVTTVMVRLWPSVLTGG